MRKHIKLLLRTLFSNNACVEAARTKEIKYNVIAVIFALFALFIAALPTCVTGFRQQGGNWLRGTTYSFEVGMEDFKDAAKGNVKLTLDKKHVLTDNGAWDIYFPAYDLDEDPADSQHPDLHCFASWQDDAEGGGRHKVLEVYYCPNKKDFNFYVTELTNNIDPIMVAEDMAAGVKKKDAEKDDKNWLEIAKEPDKKGNPVRQNRYTSFIVFGTNQVFGMLYPPGTTSAAGSGGGDYLNTKPTEDLISQTLVTTNKDFTQTLKNCRKFFDQTFINARRTNTWRSTGIIVAVDTGVVILMGFMVWILTRGKNNPFRIYSFWDGQKIAYYAAFTPGLLALFGFLMQQLAMMLFIISVGIRVMWLSMRTLRYQAPAKQ